ncbi:hypothetical protein [Oceaniglobus roseus]|uniref:hypothetical protein n=1 Tax=Oceaniglobus roseus TaxID=1737570 RepID=UPI000C7EA8F4|nr:hypothetical protein [Kandeliimicrobium roseum]
MVVLAYVLAHGLTALLVTPLQSRLIPEITPFASLVYLPHGVRVLSAWLLGRFAFFPLFAGAVLSEALFTPAGTIHALSPVILISVAVGASSAVLAFGIVKLLGHDFLASRTRRVRWNKLLIVGVLASFINSLGQSFTFSGVIVPDQSLAVLVTYAIGDLIGLIVTTLALMLIFRWMRLRAK